LWRQAAPFLEREVERVGTALARGAVDQVLDGLYPDGRVEQDRWFIEGGTTPTTIAPRLVLVPMLVGSKARFWHQDDHGGVDYVAYPLPGAHRLAWSDGQAAHDHATGLDGLLGAPRAEILRRLDRVVPAGVLACHLQCAPSVITHHLVALERAGLVRRERSGRRVFVHRTARGTALLHLYEG